MVLLHCRVDSISKKTGIRDREGNKRRMWKVSICHEDSKVKEMKSSISAEPMSAEVVYKETEIPEERNH